jgi:CBS domain-containing protein
VIRFDLEEERNAIQSLRAISFFGMAVPGARRPAGDATRAQNQPSKPLCAKGESATRHLTAKEVMSRPVITVTPSTPVQEVARLLNARRISGVPVVDSAGKLLGMVTEADLLLKEADPGDDPKPSFLFPHAAKEQHEWLRRYEGKVARDIMTAKVITVSEDTPIRKVAALLAKNRINRVPVVRGDALVGIIARHDILKVFDQSDETLRQHVRDVLREDLWIRPEPLDVRVREGQVAIRGEVERKSDVRLIADFVRIIDGVVDVDVSELRYASDDGGPR